MPIKTIKAKVSRTAMIGGGTSYDVMIPTMYKKYRPITCGQYATIICNSGSEYYRIDDFYRTPIIDKLPALTDIRLNAFRHLVKCTDRLELILAKRVFPELSKLENKLPTLWAPWDLSDASYMVDLQINTRYTL